VYLKLLELAESTARPICEVESEHLGVMHAEVGAYLLGVWGLPAALCDVVACHHEPALQGMTENPVAVAVHIADVLARAILDERPDPLAGVVESIRVRPDIEAHLGEWLDMARLAGAAS
jgi:HD-like signal output (HDOD) protein